MPIVSRQAEFSEGDETEKGAARMRLKNCRICAVRLSRYELEYARVGADAPRIPQLTAICLPCWYALNAVVSDTECTYRRAAYALHDAVRASDAEAPGREVEARRVARRGGAIRDFAERRWTQL